MDVVPADYAMDWMRDSDAFQEALLAEGSESYMSSLTHSMALVLDEFYATLKAVGVSAMTGEGCDDLFEAIDAAAAEFDEEYKPQLDAKIAERDGERAAAEARQMQQLRRDAMVEGDVVGDDGEVSGMVRVGAERREQDEDFDEYASEPSGSDSAGSGSSDEEDTGNFGSLMQMLGQLGAGGAGPEAQRQQPSRVTFGGTKFSGGDI